MAGPRSRTPRAGRHTRLPARGALPRPRRHDWSFLMTFANGPRLPAGPLLTALLVLAFLGLFLAVPVGTVFYSAFVNADGSFTLGHFGAFFGLPLMQEAFFNSLYVAGRSEEHTSELQSRENLVCRLLLEKKKNNKDSFT